MYELKEQVLKLTIGSKTIFFNSQHPLETQLKELFENSSNNIDSVPEPSKEALQAISKSLSKHFVSQQHFKLMLGLNFIWI